MESHTCCALVASVWICPWTTWVPDTGWAKRIYCSWPAFNWTWRQVEGGQGKKMETGHSAHPEHTAKKIPLLDSAAGAGVTGGASARQLRGIPKGSRQESPRGTLKVNPRSQSSWISPWHHIPAFFSRLGRGQLVAKAY